MADSSVSQKKSAKTENTLKEVSVMGNTNVPLRRSKRNNRSSQNEIQVSLKDNKPSRSKAKVPRVKSSKEKKSKPIPTPSEVNESIPYKEETMSELSVFQDSTLDSTVQADQTRMRVVNSTSGEDNMLTAGEPGNVYWKLLAEERQKALEYALAENEQLKNENEVLEVENGQLKNVLQELEKFVEIIRASIKW